MKRHMLLITLAYCLGIWAASCLHPRMHALLAAAAVIFPAGFLARNTRRVFSILILASFVIIGALMFLRQKEAGPLRIRNLAAYHPDSVYMISGYVASEPAENRGKTVFFLAADRIYGHREWFSCRERVRIEYGHPCWFGVGDGLAVTGRLKLSSAAVMTVKARQSISRQGYSRRYWLKRSASALKARLRASIQAHLSGNAEALLSGMLLGEQRCIPAWIKHELAQSGTAHILVISGFNVGFLGFWFMQVCKLVGMRRSLRILVTIPVFIFYCVLTGTTTPVVRATIMGGFFLAGYPLKRECELIHLIALSALIILCVSPQELFSLSFQLSFLSVTAIAVIYPRLRAIFPAPAQNIPFLRTLLESMGVSLAAWLGTIGLIARAFKIISPIAIVANLFIIPISSLIMISGVIFLCVSSVYLPWGSPFARVVEIFSSIMLYINHLLLKCPGAYWKIT